ncbi:MAG: helix-turn-helix domain-containing protein [Bacilli bacterium]|nr:helix-turn-helix domain-containing protein [Bacilli bacterium]
MDLKQFGKFIYKRRNSLHLSQSFIAERINANYKTVSSWENGTSLPSIFHFIALKELFNISYGELFYAEKMETPIEEEIIENLHKKPAKLPYFISVLAILLLVIGFQSVYQLSLITIKQKLITLTTPLLIATLVMPSLLPVINWNLSWIIMNFIKIPFIVLPMRSIQEVLNWPGSVVMKIL